MVVLRGIVCTWAQDEHPADLHTAQPNVPVSKRYCRKCMAYTIEDEKHFLLECPAYQAIPG
jgi:hypothetical protein